MSSSPFSPRTAVVAPPLLIAGCFERPGHDGCSDGKQSRAARHEHKATREFSRTGALEAVA